MLLAWPSNRGFHVVPLSLERHTPPPAVPTHSVLRSPETPSMHAMRPLMMPGPSERARSPSNVSLSSFQASLLAAGFSAGGGVGFSAGFPAGACASAIDAVTAQATTADRIKRAHAREERTAGMGTSLPSGSRWKAVRRGPHAKVRCATAPRIRRRYLPFFLPDDDFEAFVSFLVESVAAAADLASPVFTESVAAAAGEPPVAPAGTAKRALSIGTFSSTFVNVIFRLCCPPFGPLSIENGCIRPSTSL